MRLFILCTALLACLLIVSLVPSTAAVEDREEDRAAGDALPVWPRTHCTDPSTLVPCTLEHAPCDTLDACLERVRPFTDRVEEAADTLLKEIAELDLPGQLQYAVLWVCHFVFGDDEPNPCASPSSGGSAERQCQGDALSDPVLYCTLQQAPCKTTNECLETLTTLANHRP